MQGISRTLLLKVPAMGAYRAMASEGSRDLISDKELVTSLLELYEYYYTRLIYPDHAVQPSEKVKEVRTLLEDELERRR